ncbi:FAD binding domain-containing protein [Nakamurella lactea]|uniref:FAD binding domain-containing protein n=1 Tax=Nakamurella lactea TaxID=459515 RepID=UPI0003FE3DB1|nr:FAD binding domain-containing protein [Nakamurella lactea]
MKPAPFTWHGPRTVDEAVAVLAEVGHEGKVLAGGQSLIPVLAMRLAEPAHLVDINAVAGLDRIVVDATGVTIGALVRHASLERDDAAAAAQPLLRQALRLVAHPTIRNRGTTVGSLAHADPSGEMTSVLTLLGGTITARSARGERTIPATEFFVGPLESALAADELAVSAHFPAASAGTGSAFVEVARRHGDYALCGVGAVATVDPAGAVTGLRCGYLSVSETPLTVDLTDAWNSGDDAAAATAAAARAAVDPLPDIHATAEYRRQLAGVLTVRAAEQAVAQAVQRVGTMGRDNESGHNEEDRSA